jgi:hypothetical protein
MEAFDLMFYYGDIKILCAGCICEAMGSSHLYFSSRHYNTDAISILRLI